MKVFLSFSCRPSFSGSGVSRCGVSSRGRSLSKMFPSGLRWLACLSHTSSGHLPASGCVHQRTGEERPTHNINYICSIFPFYHHIHISGLSSKKGLVYGNCKVGASAPLLTLGGEHKVCTLDSALFSLYTNTIKHIWKQQVQGCFFELLVKYLMHIYSDVPG